MRPMPRYPTSGTAPSAMPARAAPARSGAYVRAVQAPAPGGFVQLAPLALAAAIVLGGVSPAPAGSGDEPALSVAAIAGGLVRAGIGYGRLLADIRYDALEVDGRRGALTLHGLRIAGIGENRNCRVDLGRLDLSGLSFWGAEDMRGRLEISGLSIAANCFGSNAAMIGMVTGGDTIPLDSLVIDTRQISGSGAARFDIEAVSPGIARIEASVAFDYVSLVAPRLLDEIRRGSDPYGGAPAQDFTFDKKGNPATTPATPEIGLRGELKAAHVSVEDLGLWARVQPILPPDAVGADAVRAVVTAAPGSALRAVQEDLAEALAGFIARPGRVTAEIRPDRPLAFDSTEWPDPEAAMALLRPAFTNAPPSPPLALIAAPEGDDPLALGLALADGLGLPRNSRRAIALLGPLEDSAEAMLTVARLTAESDPPAAHAHAQRAAALGDSRAPVLLDRIEARMATADLLAAQAAADMAVPEDVFASPPALRAAALAYAEGDGVARSHAMAYRLAASAAAAGDGLARSLLARLDARFGADPAWIETRNAAADLAMEDWTGRGLATRFSGE